MAKKCDRDCFNCKYDDCIVETVSEDERAMQNYRDNSLIVTGYIPKGHASGHGNRGRKGGYYDTDHFCKQIQE